MRLKLLLPFFRRCVRRFSLRWGLLKWKRKGEREEMLERLFPPVTADGNNRRLGWRQERTGRSRLRWQLQRLEQKDPGRRLLGKPPTDVLPPSRSRRRRLSRATCSGGDGSHDHAADKQRPYMPSMSLSTRKDEELKATEEVGRRAENRYSSHWPEALSQDRTSRASPPRLGSAADQRRTS